jgi:ABC-type Fe3+/spermidine/putrescine transport system ATPase subunit
MAEVELRNVSKTYGKKQVLRNITVGVKKGDLACLLGSSGSGKTTILKLLAGFEAPDRGEISIGGDRVSGDGKVIVPPHRRGIGYIFQDLALWPHMTAFGNIAFGLKARKEPAYKIKVSETAEWLGVKDLLDKYPSQLSGGQQQLVAIGRSLVLQPKVLLMDEPLANLDVKLKKVVREKIVELKETLGITIIYVSHDHREAFALASQLIILNEGRVEATGTPEAIRQADSAFIKYFIEL